MFFYYRQSWLKWHCILHDEQSKHGSQYNVTRGDQFSTTQRPPTTTLCSRDDLLIDILHTLQISMVRCQTQPRLGVQGRLETICACDQAGTKNYRGTSTRHSASPPSKGLPTLTTTDTTTAMQYSNTLNTSREQAETDHQLWETLSTWVINKGRPWTNCSSEHPPRDQTTWVKTQIQETTTVNC